MVECRKAITSSEKFVVKTANGLNKHSALERYWGNRDAFCPVYKQEEDLIHVSKCCSTERERNDLIQKLNGFPIGSHEEEVAQRVISVGQRYLFTDNFDEKETKMVFRC